MVKYCLEREIDTTDEIRRYKMSALNKELEQGVFKLLMKLIETNRVEYENGTYTWHIYGKDGKTKLVRVFIKEGEFPEIYIAGKDKILLDRQMGKELREAMGKSLQNAYSKQQQSDNAQIFALLESEVASK